MSDDPYLRESSAQRAEREASQREYEVWRKLRFERSAAGLCPDCGEDHYPYGKDPTKKISLSKQAERDRYDRYRFEVARLTKKLVAAFDAAKPTPFDENYDLIRDVLGAEAARAFEAENPLADSRFRRIKQIAQAAQWHVRLPNGETPKRICERPGCGSTRVNFVDSRTAYVSCDDFYDDARNADWILCAACEEEYHARWDEMWDAYNSSRGV